MTRGFLTGGANVNVMREELPKKHNAKFWPFAVGIVLYGGLLLLV